MRPILILLMCTAPVLAAEHVSESSRELPVAFDVDVVVAGGSLAGVEAACAAAEKGAKVLLVESRPYLGYDLCGAQRLWIDEDETPETGLTKRLFGVKKVVTPYAVKRALDQALMDGGVQFLTGTFVGELLVGKDGRPGGITIVNRSGRQAVRAKVIIDATKDAAIAHQSGAKFKSFTPGPKQFQMIVVGGELVEGKGIKGRKLPVVYRSEPASKPIWLTRDQRDGGKPGSKAKPKRGPKDFPVYEYTLRLEMPSDSFRALSAALNQARAMVYHPGLVDQAEHLTYLPENTIAPAASGSDELGAFQPAGVESLYVLNAYAGLGRAEMQQLMRSTSFAAIGRRIGIAAAETARALPATDVIGYEGSSKGSEDLAVSETAPSFRFRDCPKLKLADHDLPVLGEFDVVVVGGGTGGAPAGIAAARAGAKTLVIEFLDELGGVGTAGLIGSYWYGNRIGFTAEAQEALGSRWNVIAKSEWYRAELSKSGAEIWHGSFGCGALLDGKKVSGVVVATPFGRGVVLAKIVIDGTGNADVAAAAGAPTEFSITPMGGLSVQVAGYPHRNLGDRGNNTCYVLVDDRDVFDRWHLLVSAKRELGKKAYDMGQLIDTRERRRIVGDYKLTTVDILTRRTFPDTICHFYSNFDAAALPSSALFLVKDMKGPCFHCDMPIRCLTPKGIEGLLVVGIGASAERDAMTLTRMQPDVQNQGYAAGVAAAAAAGRTRGLIRKLDTKQLQKQLVKKGCLQQRVLTDTDSFPIGSDPLKEAVKTLHALTIQAHQENRHDETFPALAAVMGHPKASISLLREAYRKTDDTNVRTNFARILAVLGDPTGKETLLKAVEAAEGWGRGYGLTSHRKELNIFGEVDRLVIALGFVRAPEARPILVKKLEALDADSDLSHYKAICLALRLNKDKSLAAPLARLLKKKGVSGHVQPLSYYAASDGALNVPERARTNTGGGSNPLNRKFKELLVAALLVECGDHEGQGRKILEAYTTDVNGHFASYAHTVLNRFGRKDREWTTAT
jgi:flavin-dependent dehydrogenase